MISIGHQRPRTGQTKKPTSSYGTSMEQKQLPAAARCRRVCAREKFIDF